MSYRAYDLVEWPKVGQTRCYWALLSADLRFIYLDPVLAHHLEEQADTLTGKSLLSFVHPDEQTSAKHDLGGVLETRTLHGSVTRVRFARLSRVRRQLGCQNLPDLWAEADKIAVDKDYMAVDIVINWAAEGLVLCFIHASVDLTPRDNDEFSKTEWTNWCGTPWMPPDQIDLLYRRLASFVPQPENMSRVFQILSNQRDRSLLFSWPPDPIHGPASRDFAKLVENVQIGTEVPGGNDAKTSCTRRYKALQDVPQVFGGEVESIFIPHGSIIFACHKVNSTRSNAYPSASMQQLAYAQPSYSTHQSSSYYDSAYPLPSQNTSYSTGFIQSGQTTQTSYSPQRWNAPLPSTLSSLRTGSYSSTSPTQPSPSWPTPQSASYLESQSNAPFHRSISPSYNGYSPTGSNATVSPTSDVVPPPRRRISPSAGRDQVGPARTTGNRPTGVLKCSSCKATSSPEWRKGPSGKKELCNACGLRYARSRAKKEGPSQNQQRRRKEKPLIIAKRESPSPTNGLPPYPVIRRSYPDSSFSTSSAGSPSGSDIYSHSGHHLLDNITPSPSPPAPNVNFVHYAPGGVESRGTGYSGSTNFYSGPSPLANQAPVISSQESSAPSQPPPPHHLPPLGQLAQYADRMSPIGLNSSATMAPASYERERDLRELPPTPLSAEPRHNRRLIPTQP